MAIRASGILAMSEIATEFGDSAPYSLNEFYRGGSLVGQGAPNVPTSGMISMDRFYNARKAFVFNQTIAASTIFYNLRNALVSASWDQVTPVVATITVNPGVVVYGDLTTAAMSLFGLNNLPLPTGSSVTLINHGYIIGAGGTGGRGAYSSYAAGNGTDGGIAIYINTPTTIYNYGYIYGGGGGGGGQGSVLSYYSHYNGWGGSGGGGGGAGGNNPGAGGAPAYGWIYNGAYNNVTYGRGYDGTFWSGGASGGTYGRDIATCTENPAIVGKGGDLGVAGTSSVNAAAHVVVQNPGASGLAGYAIYGYGHVTWGNVGTFGGRTI